MSSLLERVLPFFSRGLYPSAPDAEFDQSWYFAKYPDVAEQFVDGWAHFVEYGDAEGRAPNADFDPSYYARTHLALEETRPYRRYINAGRRHGFLPAPAQLTPEASRDRLARALHGLRHPILIVGSDAQRAGAPLLLLDVALQLRARGYSPVFVLRRGGPLFGAFRALGPTIVSAEGWDLEAMGESLPADVPVLGNTGWSAPIIERLGRATSSLLLVHEMPDYLERNRLLRAVRRTKHIAVALPGVQSALGSRSSPSRSIDVIVPGLVTTTTRTVGRRRVAARLRRHTPGHGPVFIGAGYADRRKGFDLFLDVAWGILEHRPDAVFVWVGELSTWARRLADDAASRGLPLLTPGFSDAITDWYACSDVYLLTSRQDPGPTTVMDAAMVGVPFVGFEADIGLRSLAGLLDGIGVFTDDREVFIREAIATAAADSRQRRRDRSVFVRSVAGFDRYTGELLDKLATIGPLSRPADRPAGHWWRLVTARSRVRVARSLLITRIGGVTALTSFLRQSLIRPEDRDPRPRGRIPATVAAAQAGTVPHWALHDRASVAEIADADAAWIADPALIRSLSVPVGLHLVRDATQSVWPLASVMQRAASNIITLDQYDVGDVPQWIQRQELPPPARASDAAATPPPVGYPLAPADAVELPRPIGVFIHIYHLDMAEMLLERVGRIDHPMQRYISTDDERKAQRIRELDPESIVRVFPNRGRDIYPKVYGFADAHRDHDVVLHLHTKRSVHDDGLGGWSDHILDRLLPSAGGVNAILRLFTEIESIGMVSPTLPVRWTAAPWWGRNRPLAELITWRTGWPPLPPGAELRFPAGSMFWARSTALAPVQALAPPESAFLPGIGGIDGTLAHTIERLIGVSCGVAGLEQFFIDSPGPAPWQRRLLETRDVATLIGTR